MKDLFKEFVSILKAGAVELAKDWPFYLLAFCEALWMVGMIFVLLEVW